MLILGRHLFKYLTYTLKLLILVILLSCHAAQNSQLAADKPNQQPVGQGSPVNHQDLNDPNKSQPHPQKQQQSANVHFKYLVPNLPLSHYQFWLKNHPRTFAEFAQICSQVPNPLAIVDEIRFRALHRNLSYEIPDYSTNNFPYTRHVLSAICSKINDVQKSCWGYENGCEIIHLMPECYGSSLGNAKDEQDHKIQWFNQADFGYILERRRELSKFCLPDKSINHSIVSSLDCIRNFKSCRGENLMMKFDDLPQDQSLTTSPITYTLKQGNIGGWNCDLQKKRILEEAGHEGKLQSWYQELKNYKLNEGLNADEACDITFDKQVYFVKLDSPSNLYHYMGSALNFYATMHLNNKFSSDSEIIIWDSHVPRSKFGSIWSAFSKNRVRHIGEFAGKRVCFNKFVFALPPRTVNGLYYGTALVPGCTKTGLFDAFNKHVLHRLAIPQYANRHDLTNGIVQIIILKRSKKYRQIENEHELLQSAASLSGVKVTLEDYDELEFLGTVAKTQNADVLVGIHGAGLANTLFQTDWAALFELYDCNDKAYHDLARLRGVRYYTINDNEGKFIQKIPVDLGELDQRSGNEKFSNYRIDPDEFLRILRRIVDKVREDRLRYVERQIKESSREPSTTSSSFLAPNEPSAASEPTTTSTTTSKPEITVELNHNKGSDEL